MSIVKVCLAHNIRLDVAWIPRTFNVRADFLSRIVDYDDWQLCPFVFCQLCGVLTRLIDLPCFITLSLYALIAGSGILTVKLLIAIYIYQILVWRGLLVGFSTVSSLPFVPTC